MKTIKFMLLFIILLLTCHTAYAEGETDFFKAEQYVNEIGEELIEHIPKEAEEYIYEINSQDITDIISMPPLEIVDYALGLATEQVKEPLNTLLSITAVVVMCMFSECLAGGYISGNMSWVFCTVSVLCCALTLSGPVMECIHMAASTIIDSSDFMVSLIPVLSGVMTAGGQAVTATTYSMTVFFACQLMADIARRYLVPLLGIYLALAITGSSVEGYVNIKKIAATIKKTVNWVLGLMMSLLLGFLTIQSLVGAGADTVTTKTTKFIIGSFVPVIGSALSDAFMMTRGYLGIIKSTVGAFGILIAVLTFLPILLRVIIWYVTINVASYVAEILGTNQLSAMLSAVGGVLGVLLSILLSCVILMTVSTGIVMMTGMGVI